MLYTSLGNTDIRVSKICLGSMTWGQQNTEQQGHAQLDFAVDRGVNFIDTAEMYSVPSSADTYGATERIIGNWLQQRGGRERLIIATKVAGPCADWMPHIRNARTRLDRSNIEQAIEGSLKRLQTDYIDLYQLHWPDRKTNYFGRLGYQHDPGDSWTPIEETLAVLGGLVDSGKVRCVGVSNETPWGVMAFLRAAERAGLPRIVSIQNPYSLVNRTFEVGLAEIAIREQVGLLAYSPLAFGVLTGKYLDASPAEARLSLFPQFTRYTSPRSAAAARAYVETARSHGLQPAQMALAYVTSRPFVTSNIIGATNLDQLRQNLDSIELRLDEAVLREIEKIHKENPNPAP